MKGSEKGNAILRKAALGWLVLALGVFLGLAAAPAGAEPSVDGSTGLIFVPSADVLPSGNFSLGFHLVRSENYLSFNFGLVENLEIGADSVFVQGGRTATFLNAKYRFLPERKDAPALALGVKALNENSRVLYLVASKALPELAGVRGHLGLGTGDQGLFLGVSKVLNPVSVRPSGKQSQWYGGLPPTTLLAEFDGRQLNLGARLEVSPGLHLGAYLLNLHDGMIGLSYTTRF
ncbi:MAG: YjbH domain-containing protein [Bacillota bacterium]|nr:YjbH domain-containing protein [Bacillota bacterium]